MRRLYSTFAHGPAGAGLLVLRLVAGIALLIHALTTLKTNPQLGIFVLQALSAGLGVLLLIGLWTPIAGSLIAVISLWSTLSQPQERWYCLMVGSLGLALALLGPGAWSVDARLFGWKRLEILDQKRRNLPP